MERLTTTPFGARPVSADLINGSFTDLDGDSLPPLPQDKWVTFRDLCAARRSYGLSDRTLTVLNALLTFYPDRELRADGPMIVFPSNRTLAERANGMPESTLRRHLALLVRAGIISRHDSPNGKRYAARDCTGTIEHAFGFDLMPLLIRATEIGLTAGHAQELAEEIRRRRERVSLMLRDIAKLSEWAAGEDPDYDWSSIVEQVQTRRTRFRRRLGIDALTELEQELSDILEDVNQRIARISASESNELSASDANSERHLLKSKSDKIESEEQACGSGEHQNAKPLERTVSTVPDRLVLDACPSIRPYLEPHRPVSIALPEAAFRVARCLGISDRTVEDAHVTMGENHLMSSIAILLERAGEIRRPDAYLRKLVSKSLAGTYSPVPALHRLARA